MAGEDDQGEKGGIPCRWQKFDSASVGQPEVGDHGVWSSMGQDFPGTRKITRIAQTILTIALEGPGDQFAVVVVILYEKNMEEFTFHSNTPNPVYRTRLNKSHWSRRGAGLGGVFTVLGVADLTALSSSRSAQFAAQFPVTGIIRTEWP
jgi:hypothetical protein